MLSVIIIAKNEESNIKRALESVKWAREIIVLDSGSTDSTVSIAKQYTDKVFETDWQGFGIQKQRALDLATSDWVLNLDADEYVSDDLKNIIQSAINSSVADAYKVPIRMCFYGKPLRFSASPRRHVRLFKRSGARFSKDIVHEKIELPKKARISQIKLPILHNSFRDVSHALSKINLYSSYSAKIRINDNLKPSLLKTIAASVWMFVRCYIIQGGFMDGKPGLLFAIFSAQGSWYRGVKQLYKDREQLPT
ncbi:MAG: glycosyltransferase family 2 protein [Legionellaceae bacterium]|nr:glycosyltransferase family 2 protein [Legionellaceae bacterium]